MNLKKIALAGLLVVSSSLGGSQYQHVIGRLVSTIQEAKESRYLSDKFNYLFSYMYGPNWEETLGIGKDILLRLIENGESIIEYHSNVHINSDGKAYTGDFFQLRLEEGISGFFNQINIIIIPTENTDEWLIKVSIELGDYITKVDTYVTPQTASEFRVNLRDIFSPYTEDGIESVPQASWQEA